MRIILISLILLAGCAGRQQVQKPVKQQPVVKMTVEADTLYIPVVSEEKKDDCGHKWYHDLYNVATATIITLVLTR